MAHAIRIWGNFESRIVNKSDYIPHATTIASTSPSHTTSDLGVVPFRLPFVRKLQVDSILAILPLFLFETCLAFFALFTTIAHTRSLLILSRIESSYPPAISEVDPML